MYKCQTPILFLSLLDSFLGFSPFLFLLTTNGIKFLNYSKLDAFVGLRKGALAVNLIGSIISILLAIIGSKDLIFLICLSGFLGFSLTLLGELTSSMWV